MDCFLSLIPACYCFLCVLRMVLRKILLQPCLYHILQIFPSVFQYIQAASYLCFRTEVSDRLLHPLILSSAMTEKRQKNLPRHIVLLQPCRQRRSNGSAPVRGTGKDNIIFVSSFGYRKQRRVIPGSDLPSDLTQELLKIRRVRLPRIDLASDSSGLFFYHFCNPAGFP